MDAPRLALVGASAVVGGAINAIAGGGSLVTFPVLVACGLPAIEASATNTVALCSGYLGATYAQRGLIGEQRARLARIAPLAALGGVIGALLLLRTGEATFDIVVPFLLVFAVALLAFQDRIHAALPAGAKHELAAPIAIGLGAIYGGYFGAGLGVIILAVLAVTTRDELGRLNALKQAVSFAVNVPASIVFAIRAPLDGEIIGVMAIGALVGGIGGAVIAARVSAKLLRAVVVIVGLAVAAVYIVKLAR